ncbi:DUF4214 domain-containing protein [Cellulomonas chengniuliangii]|uniref:DUF4214 domain-containing protein n=1 Tax=Cellulomonas chengniuliangii TaxID=2968084 RepID=A0ABY5KVG7_9CELL|nr:DUF4214 domain-containing protein [Cellulomonas chengniuliangii]MCC2308726.1 DUF4214 domain-containing protein [Cellulomonas chengniuliangii]UUI74522.1 DUF4214 domain-containing protein [Cellulomonas chengniuliangii]
MRLSVQSRVIATLLTSALVGALVAAPLASPAVAASADGDATFTGRGWGHGRGMGQYGALGYARDHGWNYVQILDHYYGGTVMGSSAEATISVELTALAGTELRAVGAGLIVNGVQPVNGAVRVASAGGGQFVVQTGTSCSGGWATLGTYATVTISTVSQQDADLVRVCEGSGERSYRGVLTVQRHASTGQQSTFNVLPTEDYLRGVLPRESPDSWGALPNGLEALKAQAVAARSYALSGTRSSGARTCDTTTCQVYQGAAFKQANGARTSLEGRYADAAIAATAAQVRVKPGSSAPVRTEFSSSTGGHTAGGAFPAVPDLGDAVTLNPNRSWTVSMSLADVASRLGVGTIGAFAVTGRNGLGSDGGRVSKVVVTSADGTRTTFTGDQVRSRLGLKSDWFTVTTTSSAVSRSVVTALYQDLLGRGPDPTGLAGWTASLMSGTSQSALVNTLTRSDEYISSRVTKAYREVLGREPEPAGAAAWLSEIRAGNRTVDDVQRRFYDSVEYYEISGGTPEGYVRRLYQTVLGRPATDGEVATWAGVMRQRGNGAAVDGIWFSMEAARLRAGAYYQTFLGRGPDPTGLAGWANVLLAQGEGAVRIGIAGSLEYRDRAVARYP